MSWSASATPSPNSASSDTPHDRDEFRRAQVALKLIAEIPPPVALKLIAEGDAGTGRTVRITDFLQRPPPSSGGDMGLFTTASLEYFESHHGIASIAALRSSGLPEFTVRQLVAAGNLEPVLRGVYRIPAVPLDELARCAAVCAAHPDLVISGPTAGRIWGLRRLPRDARIHAVAPPAAQPSQSSWVIP